MSTSSTDDVTGSPRPAAASKALSLRGTPQTRVSFEGSKWTWSSATRLAEPLYPIMSDGVEKTGDRGSNGRSAVGHDKVSKSLNRSGLFGRRRDVLCRQSPAF